MRLIATLFGILIGFIGLLMSLCGAGFSFAGGVWMIALPSLAVGLLLIWVAVKILNGVNKKETEES